MSITEKPESEESRSSDYYTTSKKSEFSGSTDSEEVKKESE